MRYKPLSMHDFVQRYHDEESCVAALIRMRWPDGTRCPKCRGERLHRMSTRRCLQCSRCRTQLSITAGTILEATKLPLRKWFLALYLVASNKQGISAMSLGKHIGISRVSAWHMLHKIRSAMGERDLFYRLQGRVCVDEGYVGGGIQSANQSARSVERKSPIIAMVEERGPNQTGYIHIEPTRYVDAEACHGIILENVRPGSVIRTDGWTSYCGIAQKGYDHAPERSRRRHAAVSQFPLIHRAISNFKAWMHGCFRNACQKHLDRYAAEFCWRTNRRNMTKADYQSNHRESTLFDRILNATALSTPITWSALHRGWRDAYA